MKNKTTLEELGKNISNVRSSRKLTQEDLSSRIGISRSHLANIESGRIDIKLTTYIKLCIALDVYPNYFFKRLIVAYKEKPVIA